MRAATLGQEDAAPDRGDRLPIDVAERRGRVPVGAAHRHGAVLEDHERRDEPRARAARRRARRRDVDRAAEARRDDRHDEVVLAEERTPGVDERLERRLDCGRPHELDRRHRAPKAPSPLPREEATDVRRHAVEVVAPAHREVGLGLVGVERALEAVEPRVEERVGERTAERDAVGREPDLADARILREPDHAGKAAMEERLAQEVKPEPRRVRRALGRDPLESIERHEPERPRELLARAEHAPLVAVVRDLDVHTQRKRWRSRHQ